MQKCRFGPVIIQTEIKYKPTLTATNASIIDGARFCPNFQFEFDFV